MGHSGKYSFIDLFAGIGGLRLALEAAGAFCVYSSEKNRYCRITYESNFHETPDVDITRVSASDIPDHDILVGGFPCQPFSIAGVSMRNSLGYATGFEDRTQGTLFFELCRILSEKRPKALFLENVKHLKYHDGGRTYDVVMSSLDEMGYDVRDRVLDAQDYVPQHRERLVVVGFDRGRYGDRSMFDFDLPRPARKPRLADILEADVPPKYTLSDRLWSYLRAYAAKHRAAGNGFGYGIANPGGASRTLSARYHKDGSEILIAQDGGNPRRLTPRECARLQGFPDTFALPVSDTQAYRQLGNSVAVPLMAEVAKALVRELGRLDAAAAASRDT